MNRGLQIVLLLCLGLGVLPLYAYPTLRSLPRHLPSGMDDFLIFRDEAEANRFYYVPHRFRAVEEIRSFVRDPQLCEAVDRHQQAVNSLMNTKAILASLMEERSKLVMDILKAQRQFMEQRGQLEVQKIALNAELTRVRESDAGSPRISEIEQELAEIEVKLQGISVVTENFKRAQELIDNEIKANAEKTGELQTQIDSGKRQLTRAVGEARIQLIGPHEAPDFLKHLRDDLQLGPLDELLPLKIVGLKLQSSVDALKDLSFGDEAKIREDLGIYKGQWMNLNAFDSQRTHFGVEVSADAPQIEIPKVIHYQQVLSLIQICQIQSEQENTLPIFSELKVQFEIPIWRDAEGSQRHFSEFLTMTRRFRQDVPDEEQAWEELSRLPQIPLNPDDIWPEDLGHPSLFTGHGMYATHPVTVEITKPVVAEKGN